MCALLVRELYFSATIKAAKRLTWSHEDGVVVREIKLGELNEFIQFVSVVLKDKVGEEARVDVLV